MPTHREVPWERDARREEEDARERPRRPAARREEDLSAFAAPLAGGSPASRLPPRPVTSTATYRPQARRPATTSKAKRRSGWSQVWVILLAAGALMRLVDWHGSRSDASAAPVTVLPAAPAVGANAVAQTSAASAPAAVAAARIQMHSRLAGGNAEVWGTTTAPDGTTVHITGRTEHGRYRFLGEAPVSSGRFHTLTTLPRGLAGTSVWLRTRLVP